MYIIVDGSSVLTTYYYANLPREIQFAKTDEEKKKYYHKIDHDKHGRYTNGIKGAIKMLLQLIKVQNPEGLIVCYDVGRDTFRRKLYPQYKAQRSETPEPLKQQFAYMMDFCEKSNIPCFYSTEYEADDYAGTIAEYLTKMGKEVAVISADKDYYQLVSPNVRLWRLITNPQKQSYEQNFNVKLDEYWRKKRFPVNLYETTYGNPILSDGHLINLPSDKFIDFLGVCGDSADNIPGVAKVGPKTVLPLLQQYDSMDAVYERIKSIHTPQQKKDFTEECKQMGIRNPMNALLDGEEQYRLSRELATIKTDIAVPMSLARYQLNVDMDTVHSLLNEYQLYDIQYLLPFETY